MPASRKPFPLPSAAWLRFFVRVSCATRVSSPRVSSARDSHWLSLLSSPWACDLALRSLSRARSAARKVDCHEHDHAAGNLQRDERLGEQDPGEDRGHDRLKEQADRRERRRKVRQRVSDEALAGGVRDQRETDENPPATRGPRNHRLAGAERGGKEQDRS